MYIFEILKLACAVELSVDIRPLIVGYPVSWICWDCDLSRRAREKISPLFIVNFIVSLFNFDCENKWKQKFMFLEEWSADILVQRIGEVVIHVG